MAFYQQTARWPRGVIPYEIDPLLKNLVSSSASVISAGISMWSSKVPSLHFVERQLFLHPNWIRFVADFSKSPGTASSPVGMKGGEQVIKCSVLGPLPFTADVIAHEIGHALGLRHEHQRPDRDKFINFDPFVAFFLAGERPVDYEIRLMPFNVPFGPYDCDSIMHYPERFWHGIPYLSGNAAFGCKTVGGGFVSNGDAAAVSHLYA